MDDVKIVSLQDWYAAAVAYNTIQTTSGIVVSESGEHTLKGKINGKNASSSDYFLRLTQYWFGE